MNKMTITTKSAIKLPPVSLIAPKFMGKHKDCGGSVYYHSSASFSFRRCNVCGDNGMHGTPSPSLENE